MIDLFKFGIRCDKRNLGATSDDDDDDDDDLRDLYVGLRVILI